jgi:hypothetical protein
MLQQGARGPYYRDSFSITALTPPGVPSKSDPLSEEDDPEDRFMITP